MSHASFARPRDLRRGAGFMVGSSLLFAGMGLTVKLASHELANAEVVFFRNALGLLALLPWIARSQAPVVRTARLTDHLLRGVFGLLAMYCFFYAIAHMRLADAVLLNYSIPLFMPFIERVWLAEPMPRRLAGPLGLGFTGILLVLKPGLGLFQPVAFVAITAALFGAFAQVAIRRLTATEPTTRIVFYFGAIATAGSALPLAAVWTTPRTELVAVLLTMGVLATLAQLLLTRAYAEAPAGQVGPFIYSSVLFAGALDFAFFGLLPDGYSLAGAALVIVAGVLTLRRLEAR